MPTYIRFGDDHSVAIQETLAEAKKLIDEVGSANVPLFEVTRIDGAKLLVNAKEVRTISAGKTKDAVAEKG
ncbi:MAG TPA: hypothetical protein VIH47_02020 [Solirubrobacterales bacterium]